MIILYFITSREHRGSQDTKLQNKTGTSDGPKDTDHDRGKQGTELQNKTGTKNTDHNSLKKR